ncbi:MAG: helix-turn-helix domain-containing protein [Candidatus Paceibacterota bacterium]|jgi:excisionase family DNA binding protein
MVGLQSPPVAPTAHCSLTDVNKPTGFDPVPELLTVVEAAKFLKISVSSVRRLQEQRRIPFYKVGGSVRFARRGLLLFLQKHRVESIG